MSYYTSSPSNTRPDFFFDYVLEGQKSSSNVLEKRQSLLEDIESFWRENTSGVSENFDVPVKHDTYLNAKNLILMLPRSDMPNEVVPVSGRGHIGFDWNNPDGRSLTVVVSEESAYFAAILKNGQRLKGNLNFPFLKIPSQIIDAIAITFEK